MKPNKNLFRKCCESKRGILTKCSITEIRAKRTLEIVVLNNNELFVAISGIIKSGCID